MINKKISYVLFLLASLNIFSMRKPLEADRTWPYLYELRLDQNHNSNKNLCTNIGQPLTLLDDRVAVSASSRQVSTPVLHGATLLPKYVVLKLLAARFLPEIEKLRKGEKNNQSNKYLDSLVESLAKKYKILMSDKFQSLKNFVSWNIKEQRKEINSLMQEKQKIENYITSCKQNIVSLRKKYRETSRIHVLQRSKMQKKLLAIRKDCAKAMASLSIVEDKLKYTCSKVNAKVLLYSKNISAAIEQENSTKESLSYNDVLRQAISNEKVIIAENIYKQGYNEQYKDRTFDLSGIDLKLLKKQGYNKNEISDLKNANDLQDFTQKEFIYHIKENQFFRKEFSGKGILLPLLDKHDMCIKKGLEYNKAGDTKKALLFSNLCWRVAGSIELTKGLANLGEVAIEGIHSLWCTPLLGPKIWLYLGIFKTSFRRYM